jgi:hypothetical protein
MPYMGMAVAGLFVIGSLGLGVASIVLQRANNRARYVWAETKRGKDARSLRELARDDLKCSILSAKLHSSLELTARWRFLEGICIY